MPSKTSFFNKTIFRKSVTRFWPLWVIYAGIWVLILPLSIISQVHNSGWSLLDAQQLAYSVASEVSVVSGLLTGMAAAMAVWSFLYATRSAHGMACLPVRREGVFASVTLAGIAPLVAANILVFLLSLGAEALGGAVHVGSLLTWLGANTLNLVFFYGFAVFCAQLTGNLLVLPILYLVLNFTAVVVETIVRALAACFVFGCTYNGDMILTPLSPCVELINRCGCVAVFAETGDYEAYSQVIGYSFQGWGALGIYAAVGLLFLVFALLLFRRRRMESAGDVVAVRVLKPVFKYCFTLGCAIVLGWLICSVLVGLSCDGMGGLGILLILLGCMAVGAFIGYFAAEMLIRKSFRVWKGHWAGFGISVLVIAAVLFAAEFDLFGYESRVPDPEKVDRVSVIAEGESLMLDDADSIRAITALHQSIVEHKSLYEDYNNTPPQEGLKSVSLRLHYVSGSSTVSRCYRLYYREDHPDTYGDVLDLQNLLNTPQAIALRKATGFELTAKNIISASVESVLPAADCARLEGYGDVESYILGCYGGLSGDQIAALSQEDRASLVRENIEHYAWNFAYASDYGLYDEPEAVISEYVPYDSAGDIDMDSVCFQYRWELTPEEAMELYTDCILPDMAEQTIGKIWLIDGESYRQSVYSTTIRIDARTASDSPYSDGYRYEYFYTVPTTGSQRTNLWLSAHGVEMLTLAQLD
ncbi:MAG: hypothetical protein ACI4PC_05350 [Oscillospiraceae bacterium]